MNYLYKKDDVSLCHKDNCIKARGKHADLIAFGTTIMLILIGIAALANISK